MQADYHKTNNKYGNNNLPVAGRESHSLALEDNRVHSASLLASGAQPIQRRIIDNHGAFVHNDKRPTWRRSLKTWTAMVYNLHHNLLGQPNALKAHTNIGKLNLARTHKIPFHQLQIIIERFCNGQEVFANLQNFCNLVIKPTSPAHATMVGLLNNLQGAVIAFPMNRAAVVRAANGLLSELHNSIDNVLIGDSGINSGIGERGDWNFAVTAAGQGHLTPISGEAYQALSGGPLAFYNPGLYHRPTAHGNRVASSHITSGYPAAIVAHDPAHPVFTTRNWRGAGNYVNGVLGTSGNIRPPGQYNLQPF